LIAEILSIGTELLMGQIVNSDAQYLSRRLPELGISVYWHVTVGDNPARARDAIAQALSRADLVITTGGLGPTEDDLTKEMLAEALGLEMQLDPDSLETIASFFRGRNRPMAENNRRQAYFPQGALVMPNRRGTAPGCIVRHGEKIVAVLPGPPHELEDMYEQQLLPYLSKLKDRTITSKFLRFIGIGESDVETRLLDLFHSDNPTLALYCSPGEVMARVTASCPSGEDPSPLIEGVEREICDRLGSHVYAEGLYQSMPMTLLDLMRSRGLTLALAESCTGGMLAAQLVDCPGASDVFVEGFVTYANEAKTRALGVSPDVIVRFGAVSEECALAMAEGAKTASGADCALSVTGIAGPDGGSDEKPVGTVYVGLVGPFPERVVRLNLRGDRTRIRSLSCLNAQNLLREALLEG